MTINEEKVNHEISLLIDEASSIKDRVFELREFIKSIDFYGSQEVFDLKKENAELKAKLERAIEQRNFWIQEAQTSGLLCGRFNAEIRESDLEIRGTSAK
jgi:hypothetical protein